jgi:hypothetical protein
MMIEVVENKEAAFAVAADFRKTPLKNISIGPIRFGGLQGLEVVRVLGDFKAPGLNAAGTLTYGSDADAEGGVAGLVRIEKLLAGFSNMAPVPKLRGFEAKQSGKDVQTKFAAEDGELAKLVEFLPTLLPGR